ncbi:hypothetical protein [Pseudomonas vancouverensis]|uniref:Uncharacterized protein n=1 Tax=Pseudomonas vancouverensis TaxID=95300 RepID=A0A1H2MW39_PSEVA|nr:hypothetical protein [Pseudomonas vancouverensis]KAB0489716.1 hypothetical protein F7R09_28790 [Pseudomonas vancouverensis]TDB67212.1 hypothetical protein EIY72_03960 [Pseudomonas vancouverensis]SDU96786.1 hypothetical protein SAMN05216558_1282 [Pseudomonas vancouverensis]
MPEFDYEGLSPGAKTKIAALALKKGWSIEQAIEAIGIEFVAMGGPTLMYRQKGKLYQLAPKETLDRS